MSSDPSVDDRVAVPYFPYAVNAEEKKEGGLMADTWETCRHCGIRVKRRELTPDQATWRGGRTVIWVDSFGSAKSTWSDGHYHAGHEKRGETEDDTTK